MAAVPAHRRRGGCAASLAAAWQGLLGSHLSACVLELPQHGSIAKKVGGRKARAKKLDTHAPPCSRRRSRCYTDSVLYLFATPICCGSLQVVFL